MRVTINPEWTFREALNTAWNSYSGGQMLGSTNRIRVLEQWANVIGRDRALRELGATLNEFDTLKDASEHLGLSQYALRKLRRSFQQMPVLTPASSEPQTLEELLRQLPQMHFPTVLDLTLYAVPRLARKLGYNESEMYFEPRVSPDKPVRPDAILSPYSNGQPYIVIEVKSSLDTSTPKVPEASTRLQEFKSLTKAQFGILLTSRNLVILTDATHRVYNLTGITNEESSLIEQQLYRPPDSGSSMATQAVVPEPWIAHLLESIANAQTNDEKKRSLESFASTVLDTEQSIHCKYKNLRTASSEIDIVCEYLGRANRCFLDEYGRYFLVECKNWLKPIGAREIRDFIGKLQKTKTKLGVVFSRSGITGEANGTDAVRELHAAFDRDGICIVVVTYPDLQSTKTASEILALIDSKLDALRFDL